MSHLFECIGGDLIVYEAFHRLPLPFASGEKSCIADIATNRALPPAVFGSNQLSVTSAHRW
jgi:hypothetical protein